MGRQRRQTKTKPRGRQRHGRLRAPAAPAARMPAEQEAILRMGALVEAFSDTLEFDMSIVLLRSPVLSTGFLCVEDEVAVVVDDGSRLFDAARESLNVRPARTLIADVTLESLLDDAPQEAWQVGASLLAAINDVTACDVLYVGRHRHENQASAWELIDGRMATRYGNLGAFDPAFQAVVDSDPRDITTDVARVRRQMTDL